MGRRLAVAAARVRCGGRTLRAAPATPTLLPAARGPALWLVAPVLLPSAAVQVPAIVQVAVIVQVAAIVQVAVIVPVAGDPVVVPVAGSTVVVRGAVTRRVARRPVRRRVRGVRLRLGRSGRIRA
uniref:hypothetical protein n=1 Tax=Streptomyces maremycinicus TaxID=1679753 RepID=UPI000788FB08|nr:hypothetical protein [Streptomyces sp. NBRC 110468]